MLKARVVHHVGIPPSPVRVFRHMQITEVACCGNARNTVEHVQPSGLSRLQCALACYNKGAFESSPFHPLLGSPEMRLQSWAHQLKIIKF